MTVRSTRLWNFNCANNTTQQTVWHCPTGFRAIIKRPQLANMDSAAVQVDYFALLDQAGEYAYVWLKGFELFGQQQFPDVTIAEVSTLLGTIPVLYSPPNYVIAMPGDDVVVKFGGTANSVKCFGHGTLLELP